jgi:hypothetical protein
MGTIDVGLLNVPLIAAALSHTVRLGAEVGAYELAMDDTSPASPALLCLLFAAPASRCSSALVRLRQLLLTLLHGGH